MLFIMWQNLAKMHHTPWRLPLSFFIEDKRTYRNSDVVSSYFQQIYLNLLF